MIFYSDNKPNLVVWDAINAKVLCKFKEGRYETDDERICSELKRLGYAYSEDDKEVIETPDIEVVIDISGYTVAELKELAKERGIEGYSKMTKAELLEKLED